MERVLPMLETLMETCTQLVLPNLTTGFMEHLRSRDEWGFLQPCWKLMPP